MLSERYHNDGISILDLNELQKKMVVSVAKNISDNNYTFESPACPVCSGSEMHPVAEKDRYGLYMPVGICKGCGLVQTNPRMDQGSYNKFYDGEYRRLYVGEGAPSESFFKKQYRRGNSIYDFLKKGEALPDGEVSVFEVGCGAGGILQYFKEQGCTVQGIDLGASYLNYGVDQFQLNLKEGSLKGLTLDYKPDVIIYSHVFEHILDLIGELELIKGIAHENTVLYIEVPGLMNIHANYDKDLLSYLQNAHTFHFTQKSLTNVLAKGGFDIIHADEFVRSVSKVASQPETMAPFRNCFQETEGYLVKMERERTSVMNQLSALKRRTRNALVRAAQKAGLGS